MFWHGVTETSTWASGTVGSRNRAASLDAPPLLSRLLCPLCWLRFEVLISITSSWPHSSILSMQQVPPKENNVPNACRSCTIESLGTPWWPNPEPVTVTMGSGTFWLARSGTHQSWEPVGEVVSLPATGAENAGDRDVQRQRAPWTEGNRLRAGGTSSRQAKEHSPGSRRCARQSPGPGRQLLPPASPPGCWVLPAATSRRASPAPCLLGRGLLCWPSDIPPAAAVDQNCGSLPGPGPVYTVELPPPRLLWSRLPSTWAAGSRPQLPRHATAEGREPGPAPRGATEWLHRWLSCPVHKIPFPAGTLPLLLARCPLGVACPP